MPVILTDLNAAGHLLLLLSNLRQNDCQYSVVDACGNLVAVDIVR